MTSDYVLNIICDSGLIFKQQNGSINLIACDYFLCSSLSCAEKNSDLMEKSLKLTIMVFTKYQKSSGSILLGPIIFIVP